MLLHVYYCPRSTRDGRLGQSGPEITPQLLRNGFRPYESNLAGHSEEASGYCWVCGGGDRWIKTCLMESGSRIRLCDSCWTVLGFVIVPGNEVVAARCDGCWRYGNPREFTQLRRNSGHADAYGGLCPDCSRSMAEGAADYTRGENER